LAERTPSSGQFKAFNLQHIMKTTFIFLILFGSMHIHAQPSVKVEVSADTIPVGEIVEVTYTIENGQGSFIPPDFKDLPVVSGPSTSSSFVYADGKMTSSQSWSYMLRPEVEGKLKIPGAAYKEKSKTLDIDPVVIIVNKYGQRSSAKDLTPVPEPIQSKREKKKF
ncbi:MAG TPA: BatD family protein, partial [Saprospiraceae bacterium]|nr:BatD family protein [Saprospiraceae bacterium]